MISNQPNQYYQQSQLPQESINSYMSEYRFFYEPINDNQIYEIICKEISVEQLLNDFNDSIYNYNQPNNLYVFCFQNPIDKKIYQVTCEMISHSVIVQLLNKTLYNIELNLNEHQQQQQEFSKEHKKNLEFHLKNFLTNYTVPKQQIYEQNHNSNLNYVQNNFNPSQNSTVINNFSNNDDNTSCPGSYNCRCIQN
jgi:hypothetical protein